MISHKNAKNFAAFCALVRDLRKQHELSQKKMAELLGISVGSLRKLERGEMPRISVKIFFRIHKEFGISPAVQLSQCECRGDHWSSV